MMLLNDLLHRIRLAWAWIVAQFLGSAILVAIAVGWTRIPEKHLWQVMLTLLVPPLLLIAVFVLQAGTIRRLLHDEHPRAPLAWGAASLLAWIAIVWLGWSILDWCDGQISLWASYLNSKSPASLRAHLLTYDHLQHWMTILESVLRWIVLPGELVPFAVVSACHGWRLPLSRPLRILFNWRWWLGVAAAALLAVRVSHRLFLGAPHGTVHAQIYRVVFKLLLAWLLPVLCWVLLLAWSGVLYARQPEPDETSIDREIFAHLRTNGKWVAAVFGWMVLSVLGEVLSAATSGSRFVSIPVALVLILLAIVIFVVFVRSLMPGEAGRARIIWCALSELLWIAVATAISLVLTLWHSPFGTWVAGDVVAPALLIPLAAASAVWALRIPLKRIGHVVLDWQWWLGILWAVFTADLLPWLISAALTSAEETRSLWNIALVGLLGGTLGAGATCILLALFAVLLVRRSPEAQALVPIALTGGLSDKSAAAVVEPPAES